MVDGKDKETPEVETQDTSTDDKKEELYFGKYKSMEEAEAAFKKMESEQGQLRERLDRTERFVALVKPDAGKQTQDTDSQWTADSTVPYDLDYGYDEDEKKRMEAMALNIEDRAVARATMAYRKMEQNKSSLQRFFKVHPDLESAEELVITEAQKLLRELGGKEPIEAEAIKEVSRRVREKISAWTQQKPTPPHVEGRGSVAPQTKPQKADEGNAEPTEEQKIAEFMKEREATKRKQMGG